MTDAVRRLGKSASLWIDVGLGIAAVMLVVTAGIGAFGTARLYDNEAEVFEASELIINLERLLSLERDMEAAQRGYVITGRPDYLEPYESAPPKIRRQFDLLEPAVRGDAAQRERLASLRELLDQKQSELAATIALRRTGGFAAAQAVVLNDTGKAFMDQAQAIVDDMEVSALSRLSALRENAHTIRDLAITAGLAAGVLTLIACLSFGYLMRRLLLGEARAANSLFEQRELLRVTLSSIGDGVVATDVAGRITFFNRVAEQLTGWQSHSAVGQPITGVLTFKHASTRENVPNPALVALEERHTANLAAQTRLVARDRSETPVDGNGAPTFDEAGKLVGAVLVVRDVSERARAERALRLRTEELARSNRDLEQFAYVASHDLQEPLRAVAGPLQLLQRRYRGQLDERADEFIGHAVDGATRMQSLIDDLLSYSRVGRLEDPRQPIDTARMLDDALRNLSAAIRDTQAEITRDALPVVPAIPSQITLLFQNLVGNAIKFRSADRPARIHVSAQMRDDAWVFRVSDNGIGIDPQYYERIFLIFQRLHTRREYPGTGLGLALCKRIVEHHGGHIWVESAPGDGTTFFFTLRGPAGDDRDGGAT